MGKLTLSRLSECKNETCNKLGVFKDGFYERHTRYHTNRSEAYSAYYPTPQTEKVKGRAIGVEIECYPGSTNKINGLPHVKYWCRDCSLDNDGREIKLCGSTKNIHKKAAEVIRAISESGGFVNRRCGLHVHMSKDNVFNRNIYYIDYVYQFMYSLERSLWGLFQDRSREYVVSWLVHKGNTFENRAHPATLNPHIMIAWLDVCIKIQSAICDKVRDRNNLYDEWVESEDFMYPFRKNSYAYKYLNARKQNGGCLRDNQFSLA